MSTASTSRLHRFRARQREGKAVLHVEVCLAAHRDMLIACGLLQQWDDNDRGAIERGTERLLRTFAEEGRNAFRGLDF
jgi:hypothetical protein